VVALAPSLLTAGQADLAPGLFVRAPGPSLAVPSLADETEAGTAKVAATLWPKSPAVEPFLQQAKHSTTASDPSPVAPGVTAPAVPPARIATTRLLGADATTVTVDTKGAAVWKMTTRRSRELTQTAD
jgi:hypothetical protein